jgi:S-adenosylmethionine-diacylgycerolhomoserine-N-methlytransferase
MTARAFDTKVLSSLLRGVPREGSQAARMEAFYGPQADQYDAFRERLLSGRGDLVDMMAVPDGADIVELGGGTGFNLTYFGDRLARMGQVEIVDLCPALLRQARQRWTAQSNVRIVEADATTYVPSRPVDCVYFSYALTMIPNWRGAIDNALAMLKPGGTLGVVDFYVATHHGAFTRAFWPRWFAHDGVRLDDGPMSHLSSVLVNYRLSERRASLPYVPLLRVPSYLVVGQKPAGSPAQTRARRRLAAELWSPGS